MTADAPPFLVVHGRNDTLVPVVEARDFVERLREVAKNPVAYAEIPGAQHAFDIFPSFRSAGVLRGVARFLEWSFCPFAAKSTIGSNFPVLIYTATGDAWARGRLEEDP